MTASPASHRPGSCILLDTNLIVGLWMADPRLVDLGEALEGGRLPVATSDALLDEARDVLMRPVVRRNRAYHAVDVARWLERRFAGASHRSVLPGAAISPRAPDPGDQFLWDLLATHDDLVLWTRDRRLLRDRAFKGRVLLPPVGVPTAAVGADDGACQDPDPATARMSGRPADRT